MWRAGLPKQRTMHTWLINSKKGRFKWKHTKQLLQLGDPLSEALSHYSDILRFVDWNPRWNCCLRQCWSLYIIQFKVAQITIQDRSKFINCIVIFQQRHCFISKTFLFYYHFIITTYWHVTSIKFYYIIIVILKIRWLDV